MYKPNSERVSSLKLCAAFVAIAWSTASVSANGTDKSQYHLFHPTPRESMRELSTDRPDQTESPYTVDAGHFQFEWDFVNYVYDRHNAAHANERVETFTVMPVNLKAGLCNYADLQVVIDSFVHERTKDFAAGTSETREGFGDVTTRLKINFWGNDGGKTALGTLAYVKFPTAQDGLGNNVVEPGILFPFSAELPAGFGMGAMTGVEFTAGDSQKLRHADFVNSITVGHDIVGNLGAYVEFFTVVSTQDSSDWVGAVDGGFVYAVTENIQLDAGVNVGVTRAADDINPFVGMSVRY